MVVASVGQNDRALEETEAIGTSNVSAGGNSVDNEVSPQNDFRIATVPKLWSPSWVSYSRVRTLCV